jgi:hypothetical protein
MKSDAVEFPLMLQSMSSYLITAKPTPIPSFSPADLDTENSRLLYWLFTIKRVLVFDLVLMSSWRKVFREDGA